MTLSLVDCKLLHVINY